MPMIGSTLGRVLFACLLACVVCGVSAQAEEAAPEAKPAPEAPPAQETGPRDDFVSSHNVHNAIEEMRQRREGLLDFGIGQRVQAFDEMIYRRTRIRFAVAYTVLYQRASRGDGPLDASGGDLDWVATWDAVGEEGRNAGILSAAFEGRHRLGSLIAPAGLSTTIDSLWTTAGGFNRQDFSLIQLYWSQELLDGRLKVKFGKLSAYSSFFGNRVNSSSTMLINYAFADNPAVFMPGNGLGVHARYRFSERWSAVAGFQDANGIKTGTDFSTIEEGDLWFAAQVELSTNIRGLGRGTYRIGGWYADARASSDAEAGGGTVVSFDQELGAKWIAFFRYEFQGTALLTSDVALQSLTATRNSIRIGALLQGPFRRWPDDVFAFGIAWGDPTEGTVDDTFVTEILYRSQFSDNTQLSFGIQLIESSTIFDRVFVFSTRYRITF